MVDAAAPTALCFDMYGTLCDTDSVTPTLASELDAPGALADAVSATWRERQLRYSYLCSMMDAYEPFWSVTRRALSYALAAYGLDLSNGNPEMLRTLAADAGLADRLDAVVSADEVGAFKPTPSVYHNAADRLDREPGDCVLVSGNAWDVAGAASAGLGTAWVNRRNDPPERVGGGPDVVGESLSAVADELLA